MKIIAATCVLSIAAGFAMGVKWQDSALAALKLEHANEIIESSNQAVAVNAVHSSAVVVAQAKATTRNDATVVVVDGNRHELVRLRDELAAAAKAAASGIDACTAHGATVRELFSECSTELIEVASQADRWASHAALVQDVIESAHKEVAGDLSKEPDP